MESSKVTDLARRRAMHARPINDACRWSEAFETVATANLRVFFAWQRMMLRALGG